MTYRLIHANVIDGLQQLAEKSVHCAVTSPPYWGLRDYGTGAWEGGDASCDHQRTTLYGARSTLRQDGREHKGPYEGEKGATISVVPFRDTCGKCGAVRSDQQIGLEPTPGEYVEKIVEVFREVRRVLRDDGTLWLNLGDSYSQATVGPRSGGTLNQWKNGGRRNPEVGDSQIAREAGIPSKNMVGIPWRVAFALQADGWYLRSDIIWAKPNPMPESVSDRPTKSHEYLFLLAKSERYYYDAEAIKEPVAGNAHARGNGVNPKAKIPAGWNPEEGRHDTTAGRYRPRQNASFSGAVCELVDSRNKRTVWTIPTQPFPEAHFATFPEDLVEPCILAGSPDGGYVLDPFAGSGTVGVVALKQARHFVGVELNAEYVEMARRRLQDVEPMFHAEGVA